MIYQKTWGITLPSAIPISVASLLLSLGITTPAYSSYFVFSRDYRNGLERIKLAGKFQAKDIDGNGTISILEVKNFEGMILSQNEQQPQILAVLDLIKPKEKIKIEKFQYNLTTNNLQFVIRTLGERNYLINSLDSYWQVDFQEQIDSFKTGDRSFVALDYQGTGIANFQSENTSEINSLAVLLVLTFMLFGITQQIQTTTKKEQKQKLKISNYQ